jgi:type IV pilus assembly protein PilA
MISRMKKRIAGGFTLIELMVVVAIIGILAAVAIPAFLKNAKKAKTTEATINVKKLSDGAVTYYHEEKNAAGTAVPIAKQFPDTAATPIEPALVACCAASGQKCQPNPSLWSDATWQALKFSMDDPHYYSYGYYRNAAGAAGVAAPTINTPGGGTAVATEYYYADAQGDLNCNVVYSTFEMLGAVMTDGTITTGAGIFKNNELE